ncbi:MAG: hypothetical protein K0U20_08635 [Proteobacteria bacterium]|nr:hypothetical protein [Pseudomonadota bacterium]
MSEYLNRLKQLRDQEIDPPNVHANVSFRKAIDYIERLENRVEELEAQIVNLENQERYLLQRLKEADENRIPRELFDEFSVLKRVQPTAVKGSILAGTVSNVLDAVVRMIRERLNNA